jgi:hypothetical protein
VVDEYAADAADFEQMIRRHRLLGAPVIGVAWAAPEEHFSSASYPFHRSIFDGQLRVARLYNVPLGFFCHQDVNTENPGVKVNTWGWVDAAGEKTKKVFKLVLDAAAAARKSPSPSPDTWDLHSTPPQPVQLLPRADGQWGCREGFDLRMHCAGETAPQQEGGWDFVQRVEIGGLRCLRWRPNPSRIAVLANGGRAAEAVLKQHWTAPEDGPHRFTVVVQFAGKPSGSTKLILEASTNRYDWTAKTESLDQGQMRLAVPGRHKELHTRLRISGPAGPAGGGAPLAEVDWIEVAATKEP